MTTSESANSRSSAMTVTRISLIIRSLERNKCLKAFSMRCEPEFVLGESVLFSQHFLNSHVHSDKCRVLLYARKGKTRKSVLPMNC